MQQDLNYEKLYKEFVDYLEEMNYKIYNYKRIGELKVFHKNAWITFKENNLREIIFSGNEHHIAKLKSIVKTFLEKKGILYCYTDISKSRMRLGTDEVKQMSEEEILDLFKNAFGS